MKARRQPPAYRQLANQLRSIIFRKVVPNGGRLPTEAELSARYNLSRQTVRRAYQDLVNEGIVQRIPGRGTFAVPPGQYVRTLGSLEELLAQPEDTETELVAPLAPVDEPHEDAGERLGADRVMEVRIRRLHGGLPVSVTIVTLPGDVGRRLSRYRQLTQAGQRRRIAVLELLDRVLDPPVVEARQVIGVARVPDDVAALIDCRAGDAVLRIDRLFVDSDGRAVQLAVSYLNPTRYQYRLALRRTTT